MSFDRVLPKPTALHHESSQGPLPRKTSNLLEHKIMNDDAFKMAVDQPQPHSHRDRSPVGASCRYAADMRSSGAPPLALNRAKIALNKISSSAAGESSKPVAPLLTKDISIRDRPSSSSPVKSAIVKDPGQFCLCQPDPKIPRPRNGKVSRIQFEAHDLIDLAFILYRQHYQAAVVAQNPGLANPEISKIIGEHWRALPDETKDEWKALAEEEKARHQQQYPDYRYQPRRYGRDGTRGSGGLGHNPPGSTVCSRCGGRVMNPPVSPEGLFIPSASSLNPNMIISRKYACYQRDSARAPSPIKVGSAVELRTSLQRHFEGNGVRSPDTKRRKFNSQVAFKSNVHRDKSPDSPYPKTPYTPRADAPPSRALMQAVYTQCQYRHGKDHHPHDPSLKLPPLQTSAPPLSAATPITPFSQDGSSLETTVMTIPFLNKIKVLAKICPPLTPSFREANGLRRGAVIAVDGQDPTIVANAVDYLNTALKKEEKYQVRVFEGPDVRPRNGPSGQATVDYLQIIPLWHRVSEDIVSFVKALPEEKPPDEVSSGVSPKTIIPQTAKLQIDSPTHSSDSGVSPTPSPARSTAPLFPVALVPQYQLTTSDAFACSVPINDSYTALDHWQWMASLWRSCVGPDVTIYIRECEKDEMERAGGNTVELRLQDARTIVVRKIAGSQGLEEKILKRLGFELEDFLAQ